MVPPKAESEASRSKPPRWGGAAVSRNKLVSFVGLLLFLVYLGVIFQVLLWDAEGLPQAVLVGWGDSAYHLDIISRLASADPFQLDQPIANSQPLTYPFMVDFFSAILVRLGLSSQFSWYFPMVLFGTAVFWLLYFIGRRIFVRKELAVALVFLVIFGGGLGFLWLFQDLGDAFVQGGMSEVWKTLLDPPHEYTHLDSRTGGKPAAADVPLNIVWMVPVVSFFSHQRSFAVGASLALMVILVWIVTAKSGGQEKSNFGWWLATLGFLPLIHPHTFLSMAILFGSIFLVKFLKDTPRETMRAWAFGGLAAFLIALPQVLYLSQAGFLGKGAGESFFRPWFGWMTCSHQRSWLFCDPNVAGTDSSVIWFWTKNFGIVFWGWILAMVFFRMRRRENELAHLLVPASLLLFVLPNIFLLQPWEFDNNKALFWWWLAAIILILAVLNEARATMPRSAATLFFATIIIVGGLAGTIDVSSRIRRAFFDYDSARAATHFGFYTKAEIEAADWIRKNSKPNDAFLTNDSANNFVPMLSGRPIFLGFPGWLWTQGRGAVIEERKGVIERFFASQNPQEICNLGVKWVVWDPALFDTYPEARNLDIAKVGEIRFSQDVPRGQRHIIKLRGC